MAKITIVVENEGDPDVGLVANGGGITIERNIGDGSLIRMLDAYQFIYETADAFDGATATRTRVVRKWFRDYVKASKDVAKRVEVDRAVKTARDSITDIPD